MMGHPLAEAEVHSVVVRAANRLFVSNAGQLRLRRSGKRRIEWAIAALLANGLRRIRQFLVNVDGLVLVQTENVRVFRFDYRIGIERPAIPKVELFGYRVAVVGVHQPADTAWWKLCRGSGNRWLRADAELPLTQREARARNGIG